ncbi:MAG: trypsin-like peptidase domain-containing protein [Deltaproteobacteria bacterium]|nr:trypsin-like peptidase domain-containing protein [Deltaproteobacteria bacterium]
MVQIIGRGVLAEPAKGGVLNTWAGTGFIIDESGIAVTNNHVVTGAASLEVLVNGESHNAKVLGVSECSDLAVIKIDGDGFSPIEWASQSTDVNVDVWALGYPLADSTLAVTRGIVSKIDSSVSTPWASVDGVLEHDARIREGSSGGPLVTEDGAVVGINYAGNSEHDINLAIDAQVARPIIAQLRESKNVDSLGINGSAFRTENGSASGIWIWSVQSGSSASNAGIVAGDVLLSVEGLPVGTDGSMKDYCDVIRSRDEGAVMSLEVFRPDTAQVLTGEFNGRAIKAIDDDSSSPEAPHPPPPTPPSRVAIEDASGRISVVIPAAWNQVDGRSYEDQPTLIASADLSRFAVDRVDVSGLVVLVVDGPNDIGQQNAKRGLAGAEPPANCWLDRVDTYQDNWVEGAFARYDCRGGARQVRFLLVPDDDREFFFHLFVNLANDESDAEFGNILDSLLIDPIY